MTTNLNKVLKHIHRLLAPPGGDQSDGDLLARFIATRDEVSFAALVRRHGPMVLGVCRRMLRHDQDAEDCFQATFMVLARKAATVKRESVGSWLYAVAYRTSLEARAVNARRRTREKQVHEMPQPEFMPPEVQDWRPWLDQELNRLPEKYREVIVACDLEGRSRKIAAQQLGIAEGTLSSRLARARRLLAQRLAPHGLSLSSAALAAAVYEGVASAQVPAALFSATTKAAVLVAAGEMSAVSASSAILMKGVLKSMFLTKLKLMVGAVMVVTALGTSGLIYRASGQSAAPLQKQSDGKPRSEVERLRHENELLKLNLEVVLEKVRAQEAEVRALRAKYEPASIRPDGKRNVNIDGWKADVVPSSTGANVQLTVPKGVAVADLDVEVVGPSLKVVPGDRTGTFIDLGMAPKPRSKEELQRGIDTLEKALKELHEQLKNGNPTKQGRPKDEQPRDQSQLENAATEYQELALKLKKLQAESDVLKERVIWSARMSQPGRAYVTIAQAERDQAQFRSARFDEVETALKALRQAADAETQRKALDALDKAIKQLQSLHRKKPSSDKPH